MLTFAHYRFRWFLLWKAWQTGRKVLLVNEVNEAYTSRTCTWSGQYSVEFGRTPDHHREERDNAGP